MGKRAVVILVAGLAALTACSGGSNSVAGPSTTASSTPVAPAEPTTTTTRPEFSFDDSVPPPKLINTGKNYVAILKSLESYGNWLAAHRPDPNLVSQVVASGTKEFRLLSLDLVRLRDNDRRAIEQLGRATRYTILSAKADAFSASVVEDILVHKTVSSSGRVTSEVRFTSRTTYLILVVLVHDRWYFAADDVLQPPSTHL